MVVNIKEETNLKSEFDRKRSRSRKSLDSGEQEMMRLFILTTMMSTPEQIQESGIADKVVKFFGLENFEQFKSFQAATIAAGTSPDKIAETVDVSHFSFEGTESSLLDLIAKHESRGDYNIAYGGKHVNLTGKTIDQVIDWQRQQIRAGVASSAAGRYQFLKGTLQDLKKELHLSGNEKFDENMQDRLATALLERRGYSAFLKGDISEKTFMRRLSQEWASLPKDMNGRSYYAGDGLNKALVSPQTVLAAIRHAKEQHEDPANPDSTVTADAGKKDGLKGDFAMAHNDQPPASTPATPGHDTLKTPDNSPVASA